MSAGIQNSKTQNSVASLVISKRMSRCKKTSLALRLFLISWCIGDYSDRKPLVHRTGAYPSTDY